MASRASEHSSNSHNGADGRSAAAGRVASKRPDDPPRATDAAVAGRSVHGDGPRPRARRPAASRREPGGAAMSNSTSTLDYRSPSVRSGALLTQTAALFVDAYRELNAKRLFWITLWLSLAVVLAFAFISITPRGFKVFAWEIPSPFNSTIIPPDTFYKFLFTQWAIPWWLGVAASILALISVASIFPDFISGGSID